MKQFMNTETICNLQIIKIEFIITNVNSTFINGNFNSFYNYILQPFKAFIFLLLLTLGSQWLSVPE